MAEVDRHERLSKDVDAEKVDFDALVKNAAEMTKFATDIGARGWPIGKGGLSVLGVHPVSSLPKPEKSEPECSYSIQIYL